MPGKRLSILIASIVIGVAAIAGALLFERKADSRYISPTLEYTDEQIVATQYFDLIAASGENRNLPGNVESYCMGDDVIHLVLPESVPLDAVNVYVRDIEGRYLARRTYDLTREANIGPWKIVAERHTIPTLFFESDDHSQFEAMNASETKEETASGNLHLCAGKENIWPDGMKASLQGRGSTSWHVDTKKSYTLRFDKAQNLLGLGKNRNWNLIGNGYDQSLIKDRAFSEISEQIGIRFQPQMVSVSLYVDGKYMGVYTLTSKISVDANRIAIKKGDYLYRLDNPYPDHPIRYESDVWFEDYGMPYPVADLLYPAEPSADEGLMASQILQRFIDARDNPGIEGFTDICDLDELARFYWIQEASMNFDACSRSIYMYHTMSDNKMHFGPVWDMDLTLGSPYSKRDIDFSVPEGWKIRNIGWYQKLFERPEFVEKVIDVYRNGGVREALLGGTQVFKEKKASLGQDAYMNYMYFGHANSSGMSMVYGDTYDEYTDAMIRFYDERVRWIDAQMSI